MEVSTADEVRKLLRSKDAKVIYFYMVGCPYCEKTEPMWKDIQTKQYPFKFYNVESELTEGLVSGGFPQFHIRDKNGKVRTVKGSKESTEELERSLALGGGRKRNRSRRSTRRLRHTIRK